MKRIGFVTPWFGEGIPGGAEMELRGLTTHLHEAGVDLEILTTCVKDFNSDWNVDYYKIGIDSVYNIPVRRFRVRKRNVLAFDAVNYKLMNNQSITTEEEDIYCQEMVNSPDLYEYMETYKDEYSLFVFIPYMFGTTYYGCQIAPEKSVLIPCLHDESYAYMRCFNNVFSQIAGMIFHARSEAELAKQIYDHANVDYIVLGEGVYTDIQADSTRFIKKYNIHSPYIIYAGRKDKGKRVDVLLKYFAEYKKRNSGDLKLILIGGGEIEIPVSAKKDIIDLGFVELQDKYDACAGAELLCQPSQFESFSLVIMESWLCGRPVLVNAKCDVTKSFAIDTNGGLYFQDYFEFEGAVNYLIHHPEQAKQMGQNGRRYVLDHFSWDVIVKNYMDFLRKIANEE